MSWIYASPERHAFAFALALYALMFGSIAVLVWIIGKIPIPTRISWPCAVIFLGFAVFWLVWSANGDLGWKVFAVTGGLGAFFLISAMRRAEIKDGP